MALNTNKNLKLYYSIKEVAQMIGVRECTLRYWETEFPHLKPKTTGQKVRQYTEKDIEQIKLIYNLVKMMNQNRTGADKSADVLDTLISVRDQLMDLKKQIDGLI